MATAGHVAVFYAKGDEAWAACLMADLAAHGVRVRDATRSDRPAAVAEAQAMLIVHSWFGGSRGVGLPSEAEIAHVKASDGRVIVARRNWTKVHRDDYPGRDVVLALWDGYYQPASHRAGRVSDSGCASLLGQFGVRRANNDVPSNYVFISYRRTVNGAFVREQLRGALALGGFAVVGLLRLGEHGRARPQRGQPRHQSKARQPGHQRVSAGRGGDLRVVEFLDRTRTGNRASRARKADRPRSTNRVTAEPARRSQRHVRRGLWPRGR